MQLNFSQDTTEAATYQYVHIFDSLKDLFKNACVRKQFLNPTKVCRNVYKDFKDSKVFKNDILFNGAMSTLQIILYQDVLEYEIHLDQAKAYIKFSQYTIS